MLEEKCEGKNSEEVVKDGKVRLCLAHYEKWFFCDYAFSLERKVYCSYFTNTKIEIKEKNV